MPYAYDMKIYFWNILKKTKQAFSKFIIVIILFSVIGTTFALTAPAAQSIEASLAIRYVQNAKLFIKGEGQSTDSVEDVVSWYYNNWEEMNPGTFKIIGWSATKMAPGIWDVVLDFIDHGTHKKALWQYNSKTKLVHYLNSPAHDLSYNPMKLNKEMDKLLRETS